MPSFAHMMLPRRAPVLFTSLPSKPLYILPSTNTAERVDVRRRHAVEGDADEIHRRLEADAGQHAVVAALDHHVQRGCGLSTAGCTAELAGATDRATDADCPCGFEPLCRCDQVERARLVLRTPAPQFFTDSNTERMCSGVHFVATSALPL